MLSGMQTSLLLFILLFAYSHTIKPPGYVEPQKTDGDPNPPKYEYGYNIVGDKGGEQGKQEQRDGIYASGRYFVQNKDARQDVQYFADDWGYHPAVEYASVGPHSKSSAKFALGHEAVVQLRNKENNLPQLQGLPDTGPLKKEGGGNLPIQPQTLKPLITEPQNEQSTILQPAPSQQTIIPQPVVKETPQPPYDPFSQQVLIQEQPQQVTQQEEPQLQQVLVQQPAQEQPKYQQIEEQPELRQIVYQQEPQLQQIVQQEEPQQLQQVYYEQPQLKQVVQQEQPQQLQQVLYENPQLKQEQSQQLVFQHIQQPVENVIFPQSTPTPIVYHNQEPAQQQLVVEQQQPNIVLLGQQNIHQESAVSEKLVQTEDQTNALSYQQFGLKIRDRRPNKLVESTQHLISGQDVLDINRAVTNYDEAIKSTTPYPTATEFQVTEPSLKEQPIFVEDIENKIVSTTENILKTQEQIVSTTASTVEAVSTTFESTSPTPTIVVTPRPVSTVFLAPITAGVRLENTEHEEEKYKLSKQNVQVEVQKTVPYYLGKYEYPLTQVGYASANNSLVEQSVRDDIELGKTLLYFPGQLQHQKQLTEVDNHITLQQLPNSLIENQFLELDQQLAQGYQHQVVFQQIPTQQKEYTKIIHQPYPVKVPYEVPVPIVKQVAVPVTVEKVIEKPVHITKVVEKPVAVPQPYPVEKIVDRPVHIPIQVTKYIDRPYPVEVRVPYPQPYPVDRIVQKIVKQPYPVEVRVPVPVDRIVEKKVHVPHYIEKQVPVEKIVERPVTQYVDRPYPVHIQVPVPTPVAVPVDRVIEKKVPVPHYIEKQVPVERIVEKPVTKYIDRPYPVEVKVPVPQPYYVKVEVPRPYHVQVPVRFIEKPYYTLPVQKVNHWNYGSVALNSQIQSNLKAQLQQSLNSHIQQSLNSQVQTSANYLNSLKDVQIQPGYSTNIKGAQVQSSYSNVKDSQVQSSYSNVKVIDQSTSDGYHYPNPYAYAPQNSFYLPPKKELVISNEYLPPLDKNCDHPKVQGNDNYLGLLPPKVGQQLGKYLRKYRSARSSFNDKNIKMEYGFMPPLIPSLEIDEYGQPVEKGDK